MQKIQKFVILFTLYSLLFTLHPSLFTDVDAATANVVINANKQIQPVSPYIYGHNTSAVYYNAPLTDPIMINHVKNGGITSWKFPPGAASQRYDFRYNNYKGRFWPNMGWPSFDSGANVPSLEDELRFCHQTGAEALVTANCTFCGPDGMQEDVGGGWRGGGDFASYVPGVPDTPENRAKYYGTDLVIYIDSICAANNWKKPVYYMIGNEYRWDAMPRSTYTACVRAYTEAMKLADPDIKILGHPYYYPEEKESVQEIGKIEDYYDFHDYFVYYIPDKSDDLAYVRSAGNMDGSFTERNTYKLIKDMSDVFYEYFPGQEPILTCSEWGEDMEDAWGGFSSYIGAVYTSHVFYRFIKNKVILANAWECWSDSSQISHMFGAPPAYTPRPRYFTYMIYKNFGTTLLECYDPDEYTPGVTAFKDYKDDHDDLLVQASRREDGHIAVMVTNLSPTDSYDTQVTINGFSAMTGNVDVYVMTSTNCYEGGPGPSSTMLTGQSNQIMYRFEPFTVTCMVVKGPGDITPPSTISEVRDGTGADVDSINPTNPMNPITQLSVNWDNSADSESGISGYNYAIGTLPGATDITNWATLGNVTAVTRTGLTLTVGQVYYFSVKAINGAGLTGNATNSNGQVVTAGNTGTSGPAAYPNPYSLSRPGGMKFLVSGTEGGEVKIFTITGKFVRQITVQSGATEITWDGANEDGEKVARGVYIYKIISANGDITAGKLAIGS